MKFGKVFVEFVVVFVLAFIVSVGVSLLWNIVAHGSYVVDWASSVRLGIILGILAPWIIARGSHKGEK
ncbi:MAG: hypothetical protein WCC06_10210 [Candidatus Aminicenantales bacterium]